VTLETTAERPVPVRTISRLLVQYVERLGAQWIEGQVTQVSRRDGSPSCFFTLRDPAADMSISVRCPTEVAGRLDPPLAAGARVVVLARPEFYPARGALTFTARDIRPVGVGALLARLEQLKQLLAAEGLFAAARKRPLPFLPTTVGLVCGRGSAAEHDVLENARRRWPAVQFRVVNVAVQGPYAVAQVSEAVRELDRAPDVDLIVIARGGGSVEDLLPFSDESLLRIVAACRTPVVSAIGHEQDAPLLDLVADVRASTPTDAGKLVVPDVGEELALIADGRRRARRAVAGWLDAESARLAAVRSRPSLADPGRVVGAWEAEVVGARDRARRSLRSRLDHSTADLHHTLARVRALSPLATLDRGYAVVRRAGGAVVREAAEVGAGDTLEALLSSGRLDVSVTAVTPGPVGPADGQPG
jgi:exodeoxyribonuclease VII large subunit